MRLAIPLLLLLAACSPPVRQGGIVSTNPCADAILVRLVAPDRIAALSHYSHDPSSTSLPLSVARRFPATGGTAEEVIALRPELILTSTFTPAATRAAYAKAGLRTLVLDSPTTVAASKRQVMQIADAVSARSRGEAMVQVIDQSLLPRRKPGSSYDPLATGPRPSPGGEDSDPSALLFIAGDLANGSGTLLDDLLRRAGFRNAATDYGLTYTGTIPIETLAASPPDVIIASGDGRTADLRRKLMPDTPQASFDRRLVNCGGPSIPPALARLRAIRASL
ncbi:ABC transporter substrate-binding protein [Sphingomonas sp. SUN019]|uniref:ABC transporter substrate-binding protein n=1 Tax=Sphingomonas sp. SUN019 TaxID=2937788 RepID=UPI002164E176|nr:ABC transporter substrate-binding protein [Sphingomonas sp. SUN019]UVO50466.1 ABC transporter substrate-binding protein [Sphingomonas sp. SUN019]